MNKNHRLELIRHAFTHNRAVAITIDVRLQTLVSTAPHDFAHLLAGHDPLPESLHLRHENFGMLSTREIHECITKTSIGVEIDGEINHVVLAN